MTDTTVTDDASADVDDTAAGEIAEGATARGDLAEGGMAEGGRGGTDEPRALPAGELPEEPVKDRLLLPLLLPWLCILAIALYTLNVSRIFLAGDSTSALIIATIMTVGILAGGAAFSASPRLRTSSLAMVMGFVLVIVVAGGLLALGPSLEHGEGEATGYVEPEGPATNTVTVVAGPGLSFNGVKFTEVYETDAGINEIDYTGDPNHTLVFTDPDFAGFKLDTDGKQPKGKVELQAGDYVIYCDILGHRAAGMEATISVAGT